MPWKDNKQNDSKRGITKYLIARVLSSRKTLVFMFVVVADNNLGFWLVMNGDFHAAGE